MGVTPNGWTKTPKGKIAREMWAILEAGGEMVISTDFESEADAWRIATGWGDDEEIEARKREGWRAVRAVVIIPL
jgi:hypothetical protein